jgi:hypothetical protein
MRILGISSLAAIAASSALAIMPALATAQVTIGVGIGVAPECPYGYYDAAPYRCAPSGYYGPEWFTGGIFIGAGPWFHGHSEFRGHVNNSFHPEHGYVGTFPERGEKAEPARRVNASNFHGNEERDGRGHETHGH